MYRSWSLTDLEFLVRWEEISGEYLPSPLLFMSRTESWSDHLEQAARARAGLHDQGPELADVFDALRYPDVRVEAHGWDGRDRLAARASIRLLGVRRGDAGYLVIQQPGETVRHSAGFTITEFDATALAPEVVAALPDNTAGRGREIPLAEPGHAQDVDYDYHLSPAHETLSGTVVDQAADFLTVPAPSVGTIDVVQGHSRFGPRGITRHSMGWRDLEDDGRYVVSAADPPVATPADRKAMVEAVDALIAEVIMAIADE
ncbi:ESX secretion-associated protein EspG [Nocardia sp. 2]|uniref:ESX secretion-associated protein EspG n=1 Tax=Nocardia acididurans TaxID=2802282 RepID=A0ABS1M7S2_9NOCA|nr:ESX secretion-associated protein EspG [Nocardia acididurans]MBL1075203.1 ESX secretion-associated protein EspG [Nocardia acididurans]